MMANAVSISTSIRLKLSSVAMMSRTLAHTRRIERTSVMSKLEYFTTDDGRLAVRYLEADTDLGIAKGSEFYVID